MNAIERTLDELSLTSADLLYEKALAMRTGDGVRVNFRAAHRFFLLAALMGHPAARFQLGQMNWRGEGRPKDPVHAAMWMKLASGRPDPRAARHLEMVSADLSRAQLNQAFRLAAQFSHVEQAFRAAHSGGDADGMVKVGEALAQARGVDRDPEMASEWYRRALAARHPRAQTLLGLAYLAGDGVEKHQGEGERLLKLAADQGYADAQFELARRCLAQPSRRTEAIRLLELSGAHGHVHAQRLLGEMCKAGEIVAADAARAPAGRRDLAPHLIRAVEWFGKAAAQDDPDAQFEFAQLHAQGLGTRQDFEKAAQWYLRAAEQGHAKAAFNLGFLFAHGQGVEQDYAKAYQWYRVSERSGHESAKQSAALVGKRLADDERELADWRADSFLNGLALN